MNRSTYLQRHRAEHSKTHQGMLNHGSHMENRHSERSLAGSETALRQPLPNLIPQKTNVLTGASTKYYSNQMSAWNNTYEGLIKYQATKAEEKPVRQISAQDFDQSKFKGFENGKVSFPLRG